MVLNEGELTAFFIRHSTTPDVLDKHLSLSLTCPAKVGLNCNARLKCVACYL